MTYGRHRIDILDLNTSDPVAFGRARDEIKRVLDCYLVHGTGYPVGAHRAPEQDEREAA